MSINLRAIYAFAREFYPKNSTHNILYGTAGFRGKAEHLDSVMFRMGVLATLRSRVLGGSVIGVMITASHNPEPENGVKLIDPKGEMLASEWEILATKLANVPDTQLECEVEKIIKDHNININTSSIVYVGMDNRYHSPRLLKAVSDGVLSLKGNIKEFGIVTTPMLHYFVVAANTKEAYGLPTEEGYYNKLITAFEKLRGNLLENGNYRNYLLFDGANGVGGCKMLQFIKRMNNSLKVEIFNNGEGKINHECGADYVKVQQRSPTAIPIKFNVRCVSVDGDADRIVYYFIDENNKFHLLDGDRISTLVADYLMELLTSCNLHLRMGLIQTAYANGASTTYIKNELKVAVECVPTGVKHLHHKALEYDIGIYFEANGHGTVIFSNHAKCMINNEAEKNDNEAAKTLVNVINLVNETVGDAISDMLLVETILNHKGWDVIDWLICYTDLPNIQLKIHVIDRNTITTTDAERVCLTPVGLQEAINDVVNRYEHGRSFVRPSGTEDVVRVYAEAATKEAAESLAYEVGTLVERMAGGINQLQS